MKYMKIGEIAKKAGVSVRTLRYYDKEGLLSPSAESESGYRLYTDRDLVKLIQILMLKQLGFRLDEIKKRATQLDTREDVMRMLAEQSAHVRNEIAGLTEHLEAMDALGTEIEQMETVNFKKYADILLNLQVKNDSYRMIKHFDDEEFDVFRERIGREKTALIIARFSDLSKEAFALIGEGVQPESERGQKFAEKLWQTLMELSGGDFSVMHKITEQIDMASDIECGNNENCAEVRDATRDFMAQAMQVYHGVLGEQGVLQDLYTEAIGLLDEPPESERAQIFATKLYAATAHISPEATSKFEANMRETIKHDSQYLAVHKFMRRVLEVYENEN